MSCPVSGIDSGLESQAWGRWPLETSKCWASVDMASSMSSGLPEVNVGEGCRSLESGACNFAKVHEESPV